MGFPTPLSEDALIERPALELLASLGWEVVRAHHETPVPASSLGRETTGEVVLAQRLRAALERLNPGIPPAALQSAMEELTLDRGTMSAVEANREVYTLLKSGHRVTLQDARGREETHRVRYIDWDNPDANEWLAVSQLWVTGDIYRRRTDVVGFVNGIPLLFMELKASHRNVKDAYDDNLSDYRDTIPHLFWYNAMLILSNGSDSRMGTITSAWEHFFEWKKINDEGEEGVISLDTMLRGVCERGRFLDLVENFTLFQEATGGTLKLLAKNHQYLGVNRAVEAVGKLRENQGRLGVFWHTQGSGKSFSMLFFSQKILRKRPGNWTFVVVTDRQDLDEQIYKNFARCGAVTEGENRVRAGSAEDLKGKLREDHRYVFTLIQKFRTERGQKFPVLSDRRDVILITDEAHRSQYDIFAQNMRDALPNAAFIGFTGTPLMGTEQRTREVFGDYVSVYNFKQSVEDGATVPLYYENRIPELQLTNENLTEDMYGIIEAAELDADQEAKLEREFKRQYHLITREDRLTTIAEDVVRHFLGRGHQGKAMMICVDKLTTVKMHDKVRTAWKAELKRLRKERRDTPRYGEQEDDLDRRIRLMEETDMAVVLSSSQNEISEFRGHGLDIRRHRERMVREDLDERFKDSNDPLRLVFVCAMWITGFDVPSCSTIYLDKPMRNHTLMQTIARANRVFPEKNNGLIVDYIGVFRDLERALAIYAAPTSGTPGAREGKKPVDGKEELVEALRVAIAEATQFCRERDIDIDVLIGALQWEYVAKRDQAVDRLLADDETRREFLRRADRVVRLHKAILPDMKDGEFRPYRAVFANLAERIRSLVEKPDISTALAGINRLLDESIAADGFTINQSVMESEDTSNRIDLSQIDFEALKRYFDSKHKNIATQALRGAIEQKLDQMVRENRTRVDFLGEFQQLIEEYNSGSANVEALFAKLQIFAEKLNEEETRHMRENLSKEELAIFDLLMKPRPELSAGEEREVKKVAHELLERLKREKLVLDWRKRQQSRAVVRLTIEETLDQLPRVYSVEMYQQKCDLVFQHVFDSYYGQGASAYA